MSKDMMMRILDNYINGHKDTSKEMLVEAIECLLKLYNEEKEKNAIQKKMLNDCFDRGWIHKDKIRKKINECEEAMNKVKQFNPSTYAGIDTFIYAMAQKNILKSLLEEE